MSKDYNFYQDNICAEILKLRGFINVVDPYGQKVKVSAVLFKNYEDPSGFAIIHKYKGHKGMESENPHIVIAYIFVKPEYRRKGYFTDYIKQLQSENDELYIESSKYECIHGANKYGFKFVRKCDNGDDLLFKWCK